VQGVQKNVKKIVKLLAPGLLLALALPAQLTKVGTINIQQAVIQSKDGQTAAKALTERFEPRKRDIEAKAQSVNALEDQLRKSQNTASADALRKLQGDIDAKKKSLQRDQEDAEAEYQQEYGKVMNDLGGRLMQVIDKYARDKGFSLILDVGSQQTPVLWIATGVDITADIIAMYDANAPSTMKPAGGAAAPVPGAVKPMAAPVKPAVAPVKK
jgi:outer membrane protein